MKDFISSRLASSGSLAEIAHEILVEARAAATTKASDLRSQVEDLWQVAGEMLPRARTAEMVRRVKQACEALRNRDIIGFPRVSKSE